MGTNINMKKKNIYKGAVALAVVGLIGATFVSADAAANRRAELARSANLGQNLTEEQRGEREARREEHKAQRTEKHEAVQEALDNGDYNAWKEAVGENCPMLEKINEGNFSRLVEAHELRQEAKSIMEELGVEKDNFGQGRGGHGGSAGGCQR